MPTATAYELVVYRVGAEGELEVAFTVEVPGGARTWTPSASRCADSDSRYAWAVRARRGERSGRWSEALLFETAGRPSEDEVRQALEVLRRYGGERPAPTEIEGGEGTPSEVGSFPLPEVPGADTVAATRFPRAVIPPASFSLTVDGAFDLHGFLFQKGLPLLHTDGGTTYGNTAVGLNALVSATPGVPISTFGAGNTASGYTALQNNTTGFENTASGFEAMRSNTTGASNTASGHSALTNNTTGARNTAVGFQAGVHWTTGHSNVAVGYGARGVAAEGGTIRIGGAGFQDRAFIEGIRGAISGLPFDETVCTTSLNQLGPCTPSSLRFKEAVETMGDTATKLASLRPVTFRFKREEGREAEQPVQYGLIAEEVAAVFPTLVSYDDEGKPFTVRYSLLTPLLLNELQRQKRELADLRRRLEALTATERLRSN